MYRDGQDVLLRLRLWLSVEGSVLEYFDDRVSLKELVLHDPDLSVHVGHPLLRRVDLRGLLDLVRPRLRDHLL